MKVNKEKLRQLIKEEYSAALEETDLNELFGFGGSPSPVQVHKKFIEAFKQNLKTNNTTPKAEKGLALFLVDLLAQILNEKFKNKFGTFKRAIDTVDGVKSYVVDLVSELPPDQLRKNMDAVDKELKATLAGGQWLGEIAQVFLDILAGRKEFDELKVPTGKLPELIKKPLEEIVKKYVIEYNLQELASKIGKQPVAESLTQTNSGGNKMKVSKEKLKQMIKEELEKVMKESEADLEEALATDDAIDENRRRAARRAERDDAKKFANKQDAGRKGVYKNIEDEAEADAKKHGTRLGENVEEGLEEIKGPAARALAGGGVNIGSEIDNVRFGSDEPVEDYDLSDQIPPGSKDEFINGVLERLGIDASSELGMDIAAQLRSAAEKQRARAKERGARVMGNTSDALARREPVRVTKKGKPHKDDIKLRKYQIGTNLDRMQGTGDDSFDYEPEEELEEAKAHGGAKEKAEHNKKKMEEAQVEELRESFRRFTKLPKDTLKD